MTLKLLFTGTGASATGGYAAYTTAAGLECGHEKIFGPHDYAVSMENMNHPTAREAESSWLAAPFVDRPELAETLVVLLVRHPRKVLGTMARVRPGGGRYWLYAAIWQPRLLALGHTGDGFAYRYVTWNTIIV